MSLMTAQSQSSPLKFEKPFKPVLPSSVLIFDTVHVYVLDQADRYSKDLSS